MFRESSLGNMALGITIHARGKQFETTLVMCTAMGIIVHGLGWNGKIVAQ